MARNLADRALQGLVDPARLGVRVEGWQELRAGAARRGPGLLHSCQCRRKIEVLITRPSYDAGKHRVVEAVPPALQSGRGSVCPASVQRGSAVEWAERCCRLLIRRTHRATSEAQLQEQTSRCKSARQRPPLCMYLHVFAPANRARVRNGWHGQAQCGRIAVEASKA